ncbi:MAG: hypothetical protein ACTTIV_03750 [Campylobacter sp.]
MSFKFEFAKVAKKCFLIDIFLLIGGVILGLKFVLSSQISLICSILVLFAALKTYENLVESELRSGKFDGIDDKNTDNFTDENTQNSKKNMPKVSFVKFFSFYKIAAYAFMFGCFYALLKFHLLSGIGFLAGIFPIVFALFWSLLSKK